MPRLRPCDCNVCKNCAEPISLRRITKHRQQYGKFRAKNTEEEISSPPSSPQFDTIPISTANRFDYSESDSNSRFNFPSTNNVSTRFDSESDSNSRFNFPASLNNTSYSPDHDQFEDASSDHEIAFLPEQTSHSDSSANTDTDISDNNTSSEEDNSEDDSCVDSNSNWESEYDFKCYDSELGHKLVPNSNISLLKWLCLQIHLLVSHPTMSKSAFSHNLQIQKIIHKDSDNVLPSNYYELKKMINPFLIQKKTFHVCVNECVVFRNNAKNLYADLDKCPVCNEDRYVKSSSGRLIPRRKFIYIPIGPRLSRIYGDINLCQLVQSHPGSQYLGEDMWDVQDSPAWRELYSDEGYFDGDKKGIACSLELDGVNPFHNLGVQYSMTPIMLTLLNLPRHIRNSFGNINLLGIIPANGKRESTQIDPYMEIFVDELLHLSQCTTYSHDKAPLSFKIKLLMYVLDYPGLSKVFHQFGSGSLAGCHWCEIVGKRCEHYEKVIYLCNRKYLKESDPLRRNKYHFLEKNEDLCGKPPLRDVESEVSYRHAFENAKNKTQASFVATATGCKNTYALYNLPGHNRLTETHPDPCHTIKDVIQNVMNVVSGNKVDLNKIVTAEKKLGRVHLLRRSNEGQMDDISETKDLEREEEVSFCRDKKRKKSSTAQKSQMTKKKRCDEALPFSLTKDELNTADKRAESIHVPIGFGLKPSRFISKSGTLKSHDWKQLCTQGILKYCLRGTLSDDCRKALYLLCDSLTDLCQENINLDEIDDLEIKLNIALSMMEMHFPLHIQNITTHLLHHIPDTMRRFGPVYSCWMYVYERFNSWICKRVLNMRYPEATTTETFLLHDWCNFMLQTKRVDLNTTSNLADFSNFNEEGNEEFDDHSSKLKGKPFCLKKRHLKSIHKQMDVEICENCSVMKYYYHKEIHPKTQRVVTFKCESQESKSAHTISSCVCVEDHTSTNVTKRLGLGVYVKFGRIQHFINHIGRNGTTVSFASVRWFDNVNYEKESCLWFVEKGSSSDSSRATSYIETKLLSYPLVTAEEDNKLWFLNSGKRVD